jgi:hypothetical protein
VPHWLENSVYGGCIDAKPMDFHGETTVSILICDSPYRACNLHKTEGETNKINATFPPVCVALSIVCLVYPKALIVLEMEISKTFV